MLRLLIPVIAIALFVWLVRQIIASFRPTDAHDAEPPDLPERMDAESLTAWMHGRLVDTYVVEREGWAAERAARVEERFYAGIPAEDRIEVVVLWIPEVTAFTFGRHVYLSRRLMERVDADEPVALAVAHELGHHALGHQNARERWLDRFPAVPAGGLLAAAIVDGVRWSHSPEQELDADSYALHACALAGYDPAACLRLLDVLEADLLDRGALSAVDGPEPDDHAEPGVRESIRRWLWERESGYPSLRERRERLMELARDLAREAPDEAA